SALGCGIGNDEFNLAKLRYGKVIIMTDADVDGSHIRTLLLTFFFRHMKPLILHGHIFIAQPPLYLVSRKRHKEYVLDERQMRKTLVTLGLDGTRLEVRETSARLPEVINDFRGAKLEHLVDLLDQLTDKIHILERRGLDFAETMEHRCDGRLPTHWLIVNGQNVFCHAAKEYEEILARYADELDENNGNGNGHPSAARTVQKRVELHEVRDIEKLFENLKGRGLSIEDYLTQREESVTGEKEPAKYVLMNNGEQIE
ncbi:unnamed protein product, partial [marine sediment metagenome]